MAWMKPLRSCASAAITAASSGAAVSISRSAASACGPRCAAAPFSFKPAFFSRLTHFPPPHKQQQPWAAQQQPQWHASSMARRWSSSASAATAGAAAAASASATAAAASPRASAGRSAAATPTVASESLLQQLGGGSLQAYSERMRSAVQQYRQQQAATDSLLLPLLQQNIVLFMEGTVDNPGSLASLNVVRMLQQLQAVPLVTVDVLAHPLILGFAAARFCSSANRRPPLLVVRGECLGSHDTLLRAYASGSLQQYLAKTVGYTPAADPQQPLPIALY